MKRLLAGMAAILLVVVAAQILSGRRSSEGARSRSSLRIVSMAPNLTGLLFRLGAGDDVVGVTRYCDDPPAAAKLTSVGDFLNPNYELIVSLAPDLVLAERWSSSKSAQRLRELGLNVREVRSPHSVEEIQRLIVEVGAVLGKSEEAERLVRQMERRIEAVTERGRRYPFAPRVYLEIDSPNWTVGGPSFTSDAIELCGAVNIFADLPRPASQVSAETIVDLDPHLIVSFVATREQVAARPGWSGIAAVREGRIVDRFDEDLLSRANHRVVDGMEAFQAMLEEVMQFPGSGAAGVGDGN